MTIREPGTSTAAATWNAADDGSPGTWIASSSSSSRRVTAHAVAVAPHAARRARRAAARCGRGSARARSRSSSPSASSPASSTHDLICAEATGSSYSIAVQRRAGDRERGEAVLARLDPRAHRAQRRGDAVDRPAADRLVAVERPRAPRWPASQPGQQPHQRAGVADVDRRAGARRRAGPVPRIDERAGPRLLDQRAERARRRRASRGCRPRRGSRVTCTGSALIAPNSAARWEIDLSGGARERAAQRRARARSVALMRRATAKPSARDQRLRRGRLALAVRSTARSCRSRCRRRDRAPCRRC